MESILITLNGSIESPVDQSQLEQLRADYISPSKIEAAIAVIDDITCSANEADARISAIYKDVLRQYFDSGNAGLAYLVSELHGSLVNELQDKLEANRVAAKKAAEETLIKEGSGEDKKIDFKKAIDSKPSAYKSWYQDSSSEDEELELLTNAFTAFRKDSTDVRIPGDLEEVWPKAFSVLTECASKHGLTVFKVGDVSMKKSGFKYENFFKPGTVLKDYLATLGTEMQADLLALVNLVSFVKLRPTELLAKQAKFAVSVAFALSFILKTESKEDLDILKRCLKHDDGGRKIVRQRLLSCFATGNEAADLLLVACERLYKDNAKALEGKLTQGDLKDVSAACFTSEEGILLRCMKRQTRIEKVLVDEVDKRGNVKKVKKDKLVHGVINPNLPVNDEYLTETEKNQLRQQSALWNNRVDLLTNLTSVYRTENPLLAQGIVAKAIVDTSYEMLTRVNDIRRNRRQRIRFEAIAIAGEKKVDPTVWLASVKKVMEGESSMDFSGLCRDELLSLTLSKLKA